MTAREENTFHILFAKVEDERLVGAALILNFEDERRPCQSHSLAGNNASKIFSQRSVQAEKTLRKYFRNGPCGQRKRFENIFVMVRAGREKKINFCVPRGPPPRGAAEPGPPRHAKIGKNVTQKSLNDQDPYAMPVASIFAIEI